MSAPYQVWVFDGRSPELLGSAADKGAARKLWRNSRNAVIASGGVVLETRTGTATRLVPALTLAVAAAWREAGGAPPEPLPVPPPRVPGSKPAPSGARKASPVPDEAPRGGRKAPRPIDDEEEPDLAEDTSADDDDLDTDDPDDPPEVDLDEAWADEEREAQRGPGDIDVHDLDEPLHSTPAPEESRAIVAEPAPQPSTPADPSPGALGDPSPSAPSDPPPASTPTPPPSRGFVETTAECEACGRHAYRYRPELPEAFRGLCYNDRRRAQKQLVADPSRTPEQARDLVVTAVRAQLATRAANRERYRTTKSGRPRGRPPTPGWTKLRREVEQLLKLAGRLGGLEGLQRLEATRRTGPVEAVAAYAAATMARMKASHCVELHARVEGRDMRLTAQWVDGKSPLTLRTEALAERDAAVAALTAAQAASVRVRQLVERAGGIERLEAIFAWAEGLMKLGDGGGR